MTSVLRLTVLCLEGHRNASASLWQGTELFPNTPVGRRDQSWQTLALQAESILKDIWAFRRRDPSGPRWPWKGLGSPTVSRSVAASQTGLRLEPVQGRELTRVPTTAEGLMATAQSALD